MEKYEFGGQRGCCAFSEIIMAYSMSDAEAKARQWCDENDATFEYCIKI